VAYFKSNLRRRSGWGGRSGGFAQDFEHNRAASRAFALNGFAAVFHGFFDAVGDWLFSLALDAISFRHKKIYCPRFMQRQFRRLSTKARTVNSNRKSLENKRDRVKFRGILPGFRVNKIIITHS
jgi:hypothetical protein